MSEPKTLTVVEDVDSYTEAAYLDGVLVAEEDTLYACELTRVAGGEPVVLVFRNVEWEDDWPKKLSDLPAAD